MANKVVDLTGQKFGKLTVIGRHGYIEGKNRKYITWACKCDCGNEVIRTSGHLKAGYQSCCDSCNKNIPDDLTGQRFGRWTVIERAQNHKRQSAYLCKCDCGTKRVVLAKSLKKRMSISCGCYHKEILKDQLTTHGLTDERIYTIYHNMIQRCTNPNNDRYLDYGGRGISVCQEWKNDFKAFYDWSMTNGYAENLTIDRINVDGNYEPNNCRWVTMKKQINNKRNSILFTFYGITKSLKEWCDCIGENYQKMYGRYHRGYETFRKNELEKIKKYLENGGI